MIKQYPTPYRHAGSLASGSAEPAPGDIVQIMNDGTIAAYGTAGTVAAYAVFHRKRLDDGKYEALSGIIASFAAEAGFAPNVGDTVYIVDSKTISTSDATGTRPVLGKALGQASDGTYFVYVKGLLA